MYTERGGVHVLLRRTIIHIILMLASSMVAFWYYVVCISRSRAMICRFVEVTLLGNIGGTDLDHSDELQQHWRTKLREYSLQDLMAIGLPYMPVMYLAFVVATCVYDPSMRFLVYAARPHHLQNWTTFGLCLLEEIQFLAIVVAAMGPMLVIQVISFDLVANQLRLSIRKIRKEPQECLYIPPLPSALQLHIQQHQQLAKFHRKHK